MRQLTHHKHPNNQHKQICTKKVLIPRQNIFLNENITHLSEEQYYKNCHNCPPFKYLSDGESSPIYQHVK